MATITPVSYNTGSTIGGTTQIGSLAVGTSPQDYSTEPGGVRYWATPDKELGYVIAEANVLGNQPNPLSISPTNVGFYRSEALTEESFIDLAEYMSRFINNPQTFTGGTDAVTWLNTNGFWTSYSPKTPYTELQNIAEYLRGYMSEFRNPSFYAYRLDGNGFEINDGGGDMYDSGNITSPWLISDISYTGDSSYSFGTYPYAINYQNSGVTTNTDTSFGYISLGYEQFGGSQSLTYLPLTVLGARDNHNYGDGLPVGFQSGGNSGADGGGTLAVGNIYTGNTVSGFTVHSYYRQTYNAGDPSHCDLFILMGHTNWNSTFGTVYYAGSPTNTGSNGSTLYTKGPNTKNILSIKTLLSKNGGQQVTFNEIKNVVDNFIIRIKQSQSF